ncbi:MAG: 16S rRNA (cytidine(1402)-2'-O)-methyltransferase [Candidatus Edwardsbacteria bacterium]
MPGCLYLVSTPIGNLEDITLRALRILKEVNLIAAEDTRRTGKLLKHFKIQTPLLSFHEYNKEKQVGKLLEQWKDGKKIALVSDSGTPGISDPGYYLVLLAIQQGCQIIPIPGPTAFVSALIASGLPTNSFIFLGFLPTKRGKRERKLTELLEEQRTLIFYESPHRLLNTLDDLLKIFGERKVAIARELTKVFEEIQRGSLSQLMEHYRKKKPKGEFVLVIEGKRENGTPIQTN